MLIQTCMALKTSFSCGAAYFLYIGELSLLLFWYRTYTYVHEEYLLCSFLVMSFSGFDIRVLLS